MLLAAVVTACAAGPSETPSAPLTTSSADDALLTSPEPAPPAAHLGTRSSETKPSETKPSETKPSEPGSDHTDPDGTQLAATEPTPAFAATYGDDPPPSASPDPPCTAGPAPTFLEPNGPRKHFSIHGYVAYDLPIERIVAGQRRIHCLRIGWPAGNVNNEGAPSNVADRIGPSWFRALENTLARVPWHHVQTLQRVIIDNRPKEHGIAPYNRRSPDDARDGRTMWLHEHLFLDPNHWGHGNHGSYWSYHINDDGKTFASLPPDHTAFSPVLLHELGHLVMYNVVNGGSSMYDTPRCAHTCGDRGTCSEISQAEREAGCVSPYCMPFRFPAGTENFAEQYRFHYQSAITRTLLRRHRAGCADLLEDQDRLGPEPHLAPWEQGLPESDYRRSLWKSCQGRACKDF
jgi:hypothetical protein